MQWTVVLPLEIVIASETIQYWDQDTNIAVWITMFMIVLVLINVFGVLGYGEEEFLTSLLKLSAIVVFLFIGIILVCGGGPERGIYNEYWGARYWYDPGAFQNGFKGFCSVFVTAAFAFAGTELVGLAAAESRTPLISLPSAVKQVFWRIILFYILALLFVGMLISPTDERLIGAGGGVGTESSASPFVLVGNYAGLTGFDSFMNVVICISVISIGNSGIYGGSRTLTAMAEQGYAPKIFTYVDRAGRPLMSTIAVIAWGLLSYVALASSAVEVFDWLLALSGLSSLFTWGSICFAHIRFRQAWAYNGHSLDEIPFKAIAGVYGSWLGLGIIVLVLIAQFYVALFPPLNDGEINDAEGFFLSYLALPVVIFFWVCGYFWKKSGWLKVSQMDVDSGRRHIDWDEHRARQEKRRNANVIKRIGYFLF
jgi:yeast amino acid transporter